MQVLVVDDHPLIHEVMRAVVQRAVSPAVVHTAFDLSSAVARARRVKHLDLVVLDLRLPDCSGIDALKRFRKQFPKVPVVVLSAIEEAGVVRDAIAAGAKGYLPKTSGTDVMQFALRLVASGGTYVPPQALQNRSIAAPPAAEGVARFGMSDRQVEVLRCVVRGLHNKQIADELNISENTVKHHVHEVYRALGVSTRTEAVVAALRQGLRLD